MQPWMFDYFKLKNIRFWDQGLNHAIEDMTISNNNNNTSNSNNMPISFNQIEGNGNGKGNIDNTKRKITSVNSNDNGSSPPKKRRKLRLTLNKSIKNSKSQVRVHPQKQYIPMTILTTTNNKPIAKKVKFTIPQNANTKGTKRKRKDKKQKNRPKKKQKLNSKSVIKKEDKKPSTRVRYGQWVPFAKQSHQDVMFFLCLGPKKDASDTLRHRKSNCWWECRFCKHTEIGKDWQIEHMWWHSYFGHFCLKDELENGVKVDALEPIMDCGMVCGNEQCRLPFCDGEDGLKHIKDCGYNMVRLFGQRKSPEWWHIILQKHKKLKLLSAKKLGWDEWKGHTYLKLDVVKNWEGNDKHIYELKTSEEAQIALNIQFTHK